MGQLIDRCACIDECRNARKLPAKIVDDFERRGLRKILVRLEAVVRSLQALSTQDLALKGDGYRIRLHIYGYGTVYGTYPCSAVE